MATTQKQVKTRIQQKHDTSANWAKATSFVPLKGEIVVYDDLGRIKVGDGTKTVTNLKFVDEHSHPYLPLTGGTLTGDLTVSDGNSSDVTISSDQIDIYNNGNRTSIVPNGISFLDPEGASIDLSTLGISFSRTGGTLKGISDSKGTDSELAVSQKCLNDNYLPLSGGTLTGALTATKFMGDGSGLTSIPAGQLTGIVDAARLPDLSSKYLPISGGTMTGTLAFGGPTQLTSNTITSGSFLTQKGASGYVKLIENQVSFYSHSDALQGTITGISDSIGTSSTVAVSQKCLADNYIDKTNEVLNNFIKVLYNGPGGTFLLDFEDGNSNDPIMISQDSISAPQFYGNVIGSLQGTISFDDDNGGISGISDSKGTSSNIVASLKCLNDNYLPLSGGTLTGQLTLSSTGIKFNTNAIKDITYSTTDLVAGTSTLATNSIYIVYE